MTFPVNPTNGDTFLIGSTEFIFNSSKNQWKGKILMSGGSTGSSNANYIGTTPPVNPEPGQIWFDESIGKLFIWNSSAWIDVSPR
jgi:hypothetical protein